MTGVGRSLAAAAATREGLVSRPASMPGGRADPSRGTDWGAGSSGKDSTETRVSRLAGAARTAPSWAWRHGHNPSRRAGPSAPSRTNRPSGPEGPVNPSGTGEHVARNESSEAARPCPTRPWSRHHASSFPGLRVTHLSPCSRLEASNLARGSPRGKANLRRPAGPRLYDQAAACPRVVLRVSGRPLAGRNIGVLPGMHFGSDLTSPLSTI